MHFLYELSSGTYESIIFLNIADRDVSLIYIPFYMQKKINMICITLAFISAVFDMVNPQEVAIGYGKWVI